MSGFSSAGDVTGSFTPGFSFGGGTTGITYSAQTGFWLRRGSMWWVDGRITLTNKGSSTGDMLLTGFPINLAFGNGGLVEVTYYGGFSSLSGGIKLRPNTGANSMIMQTHGATAVASLTNANAGNASDMVFSGWFRG